MTCLAFTERLKLRSNTKISPTVPPVELLPPSAVKRAVGDKSRGALWTGENSWRGKGKGGRGRLSRTHTCPLWVLLHWILCPAEQEHLFTDFSAECAWCAQTVSAVRHLLLGCAERSRRTESGWVQTSRWSKLRGSARYDRVQRESQLCAMSRRSNDGGERRGFGLSARSLSESDGAPGGGGVPRLHRNSRFPQ